MEFESLLQHISRIEKEPLGGLESQYKMAPAIRKQFVDSNFEHYNPIKAGVLAILYPKNGEANILLTLRAAYNGVHSAQISFPGGKQEPHDYDLKETALREAHEEVGIPKNKISIIKTLTETYIPPSNFLVQPFLGLSKEALHFNFNHEVRKIVEVKLDDLLNESSVTTKNMSTSYMKNIDVPCFILNNYIVWGATAMMLSEIKDLLKLL